MRQYDSGALPPTTCAAKRDRHRARVRQGQLAAELDQHCCSSPQARDKRRQLQQRRRRPATRRIDTTQHDLTWQNDVAIGADVLQLLYDHRKEEVATNGAAALNRDRSTNAFAASYNARTRRHTCSTPARARDNRVYGGKNTGAVGYGYSFSNAPARHRQLRHQLPRADLSTSCTYPGYGKPANNRPEKGRNAEVGLRYDDGVQRHRRQLLPQPPDRPAGQHHALPVRHGDYNMRLRLQRQQRGRWKA